MCSGILDAFSSAGDTASNVGQAAADTGSAIGTAVVNTASDSANAISENASSFSDNPVKSTLGIVGEVQGFKKNLGLAVEEPLGLAKKDKDGNLQSLLPSGNSVNPYSTPVLQTPESSKQMADLASQVQPSPIGKVSIPAIRPMSDYYNSYLQSYGGVNNG